MHSSSGNDCAGAGQSIQTGALPDPGGPLLAGKTMVYGDNQFAGIQALATSPPQGSPFPGDYSSITGTVAAACLPVKRSNLLTTGLPPNVVATIESARASSTRGLYAYKW